MTKFKITYANKAIDYVSGRNEKAALRSRLYAKHRVVRVERVSPINTTDMFFI